MDQVNKKQGFIARLFNKLDKKLAEKAKKSSSCCGTDSKGGSSCCGNSDKKGGSSCC